MDIVMGWCIWALIRVGTLVVVAITTISALWG